MIIPELELRQIPVQMLLAAMLIDALHAALENGEGALDGVRVDRAILIIDLLAATVQRMTMLGELAAEGPAKGPMRISYASPACDNCAISARRCQALFYPSGSVGLAAPARPGVPISFVTSPPRRCYGGRQSIRRRSRKMTGPALVPASLRPASGDAR
jgi:hypothetical protein